MTRRFGSSVVVVAVALSLLPMIPGSASANPLAARAKAAAAQKLTDQVMKTVDPKISEIVAKAPLMPDFKAEIEMKLSASARDIVKREIDGAAGGKLPNPTALANKVISEVGKLAESLIASAIDRAASGAGVVAVAPAGTSSESRAPASQPSQIPASERPRLAIMPITGGSDEEGKTIGALFSMQNSLRTAFNIATDADAVNAEYELFGYIKNFGDRNIFIATIIHRGTSGVVAGGYRLYESIEAIPEMIPAIAEDMAAAATHGGGKRPGLVVAPFDSVGDVGEEAESNEQRILSQMLAVAIANTGKYAVLQHPTASIVRTALDSLKSAKVDHTVEERAMAIGEIAKNRIDAVLFAETHSLGNMNILFTQLFSAKDGSRIAGENLNFKTLEDAAAQMSKFAEHLTDKVSSVPEPQIVHAPTTPVTPVVTQSEPMSSAHVSSSVPYINFSRGARFGTWLLNTFPTGIGLGSHVIMRDHKGGLIQSGIFFGSYALAGLSYLAVDDLNPLVMVAGLLSWQIYNIYRSATYGRPARSASVTNGGLLIGAFPDRNGNWRAVAAYNLGF